MHRTRRALRDALMALLPEVGWDHIDVAKLCERADIGRSTFYLHYTDKTALLRGAFGDLQEHLLSDLDTRNEAASPFPFLPGLLTMCTNNKRCSGPCSAAVPATPYKRISRTC